MVKSANTTGPGNIWLSGSMTGFIWDDDPTQGDGAQLFPLLEGELSIGVLNFLSLELGSRVISYAWDRRPQFGNLRGTCAFNFGNAKDLHINSLGAEISFFYNTADAFPSLGGYRENGTGFSPEGFLCEGGNLEFKLLYELDITPIQSLLPLRGLINLGGRIPLTSKYRPFSQYLFGLAVLFSSSTIDIFAEYSLEAFFNGNWEPKKFSAELGTDRIFEVSFSENPMFLTLGGKIRYGNGIIFTGCIPILLSQNKGSDMTYRGDTRQLWEDYPKEKGRGIQDPFDPWYSKWKIVLNLAFPLRYSQTGTELRRAFLLKKNMSERREFELENWINSLLPVRIRDSEKKDRRSGEDSPGKSEEPKQ